MDGTIVHDNDGVGPGERIHFLQKVLNECNKKLCVERTFDDEAFNDAIYCDSWKN